MYSNITKALRIILKEEYNKKNPLVSLRGIAPEGCLVTARENETIIYQKDPAAYLYMLLCGRAVILNQISWNSDNVIDYVESPHILGLVEYLNNIDYYTAFVVAKTRCVMFRILVSDFVQIIKTDASLCYPTLVIMGKITDSNMNHAERHKTFHPKDILGHYLYLRASSHLPYTCPLTRNALAEELHINLRTLYRHIDDMEKKGYLTLRKGKIVIEEEHLEKLADRYGDVIL